MPPKRVKRARHGGYKQHLESELVDLEASGSGYSPVLVSTFAIFIVCLWAWGLVSPQRVQKLCFKMHADVERLNASNAAKVGVDVSEFQVFPDIKRLADIGGKGQCSNNCYRDLINLLGDTHIRIPAPVSIPIKIRQSWQGFGDHLQYFLWPHQLFSDIYHDYKDAWQTTITTGSEQNGRFWGTQDNSPQFVDAVRNRENLRTHCVPIAVHGDGVAVAGRAKAWTKVLDVWSWCSLLGTGKTLDMQFYIFSLFQGLLSTKDGRSTYRRIHERMRWSLFWLWLGRHPTHDPYGEPYAED